MKGKNVYAFVDDVSLGTDKEEDHLMKHKNLFKIFQNSDIRLKLSKRRFGVREVDILSHSVDKEGLQPLAGSLEAIKELKLKKQGDELLRFLGLENFFAYFIDHFSSTKKPFYDKLKGTIF